MADKTITRADLGEAVYKMVGLSRAEAAELVEAVIGEISSTLTGGKSVSLSGFGSFKVRTTGERVGRNPKTGVEAPIAQRKVIAFKPSDLLKARMNGEVVEGKG